MFAAKRLAALLPASWQQELRRIHYQRQMRRNQFVTSEPEYDLLHTLISPGDCVIDVGANIGLYTRRLSELVGEQGRVLAFEPVPDTFALLTSNAQLFAFPNVTLINAALSDTATFCNMSMPVFANGLKNFYQARLTQDANGISVMTMLLDELSIAQRVSLIKIDVEGHEKTVLAGMTCLLRRDHPTLIVETQSATVEDDLCSLGYHAEHLKNSPNVLFRPDAISVSRTPPIRESRY